MESWWKMQMKRREEEDVDVDGGQQNVIQMAAVGDGNRKKAKAGEWVGLERWDFDFMLFTSKARL